MGMVYEDRSWPEKYNRLPDKSGETEKITINVGFVDLGHIDLLVHESFYSNRTDFIRTAIRNQLAAHADAVKQSIVRHAHELGLRRYSREELEAVKAAGGKLHIQVVGLATIAEEACGRTWLRSRLSETTNKSQSISLLELVQPQGPDARFGGTEHYRGDYSHQNGGIKDRCRARLGGGPFCWRRHG
jgi:Arc/MetJ-type ribon-helix-helix transcriptional regulator